MRRDWLIIALLVLALRLPFLNQAIQGDDIDYLYGAEHAQIEPLHPTHTSYAFMGRIVDMRGHPHPPLNAWFLAVLLAIFKDVYEVPFHAAYILFSLIAAFSALSLARRFSPRPLAATLLFIAAPAFVINGNSLESDLPFLALWLLAIALFVAAVDGNSTRLLVSSVVAMALAAMTAYQAVVLTPILLVYCWRRTRRWLMWMAALTTPVMIVLWQLFERLSSGSMPAAMLAGYMQTYGLQAIQHKEQNAVALTAHLAWIVCPVLWLPTLIAAPAAVGAVFYDWNPLFWASIAVGVGILIWCVQHWRDFLAQWILIFFAGALVIFFAGQARYLLPVAAPLAILASRYARRGLLQLAFGVSLALGVTLAFVNYQHWDGYRKFARQIKSDVESKRVWVNDEWGLRFYLEAEGARPLLAGQAIHPGEMVVSSSLAPPIPFSSGGGAMVMTAERTITSPIPLRLVSLHGKSAYSALINGLRPGLRPFDISFDPMDQVRAEIMVERQPELSDLVMNAKQAGEQIVSGVYQLENNSWRWMSRTATVLLKPPAEPLPLVVHFVIADPSPAREVKLSLNGREIASQKLEGPGRHFVASPPQQPAGASSTVTIAVDKTFSVQGDSRELGVILLRVGFEKP